MTVTVILQRPVETVGSMGQVNRAWTDVRHLFGIIRSLRTDEIALLDKDTVVGTHRMYLMKPLIGITLTENDRIKFNKGSITKYFDIVGVVDKDQRGSYFLDLREVK